MANSPKTLTAWPEQPYSFASPAEADATYLVIAWFAITETASLGILPLLPALETARRQDTAAFHRFFEPSFQHLTDEQHHANLWCRALADFVELYPEVVRRVELPSFYFRIMLRSIGKPHDELGFRIDCLAFEIVMQALYEVLQPRLSYPPLAHIWQVIIADEIAHTDFGRQALRWQNGRSRFRIAFRFWRNVAGVLVTIKPMLKAVEQFQPIPKGEFRRRLAVYARHNEILGSERLIPTLIGWGV